MPSILLPRRFYNQPQCAVQVDWEHPLLKGCGYVFDGRNSYTRDGEVVSGTINGVCEYGVYGTSGGVHAKPVHGKYYKALAGRMRLKVAADLTNYDAFAKEGYYASNTDNELFQVGNWVTSGTHGLNYRYDSPDLAASTWPETFPRADTFTLLGDYTAATIKYYRSGVLYKSGARKGSAVPAYDSRAEVEFSHCVYGFAYGSDSPIEIDWDALHRNPWQVFRVSE